MPSAVLAMTDSVCLTVVCHTLVSRTFKDHVYFQGLSRPLKCGKTFKDFQGDFQGPARALLNDLEWLKRTLLQKRCVFWSPLATAQIWIKIHPYLQRQKCRPMTLVCGNIKYMRIFLRVPLGGGLKWELGCRRLQFLAIWVATSSET